MKAPSSEPDPSAIEKVESQVIQNILDKIRSGGIPNERESRKLESVLGEKAAQGRPAKTIRWTVEHAATEFGPDRRTLAKRLRDESIEPGADGKYATRDICQAVFTNNSPRDQKDRQHTELLKVQTENARRERIPVALVLELWSSALSAFASTLKAARGKTLTPEKINELLAALRETKLPLKW